MPPTYRLLLIEDNPDHAELAEIALKQNIPNLEIVTCYSSKECLATLQTQRFDVLLLDYFLPDKNGLELMDELIRQGITTPVIVITGQGNERVAVEAMKKGAYEYIIKSQGYLLTLPVTVRKVLERQQLKEQLTESEQRYRDLVENMGDGVFQLNQQGEFVFINRRMEEILGCSREEVRGLSFREFLGEEGQEVFVRALQRVERTERIKTVELTILSRHGRQTPVEMNLVPLIQEGEVVRFQGVIRDISLRKRLEEERRRQREKIQAMNEELRQKNRKLEELNRMKNQFLSNISHELKTPLSGILGYAELLKDGFYGEVSSEQKEALQNILACGHHLLELIDEILDLMHIQEGRAALGLEVCSVYSILDAVVATIKPIVLEKRLQLALNTEENLPMVYVDPRKIYQALLNLAESSLQFVSGGEIEIGAERKEKEIHCFVRRVHVASPGPQMEHILEAFRKTNGDIQAICKEVGLGLALTKKLVEMHGGRLWVESNGNGGFAFYFSLPIQEDWEKLISDKLSGSGQEGPISSYGFFGP